MIRTCYQSCTHSKIIALLLFILWGYYLINTRFKQQKTKKAFDAGLLHDVILGLEKKNLTQCLFVMNVGNSS